MQQCVCQPQRVEGLRWTHKPMG